MEVFSEFLTGMDNPDQRMRVEDIFTWIAEKFPNLEPVVKWNQPMFTDHGTYIIGFSVSKQHLAVAPESVTIEKFSKQIEQAGYDHMKEIIRIKWKDPVDYVLLEKMIAFNIEDKVDCRTFWRK